MVSQHLPASSIMYTTTECTITDIICYRIEHKKRNFWLFSKNVNWTELSEGTTDWFNLPEARGLVGITGRFLTSRETQVLELLSKGKSYTVIADELFIHKETVKSHIRNTYFKLQVHSKAETIEIALKNKFI